MNGLDISLSVFCSTSESAQSTNYKSIFTFASMATKLNKQKKKMKKRNIANKLFKQDLGAWKAQGSACDLPSLSYSCSCDLAAV